MYRNIRTYMILLVGFFVLNPCNSQIVGDTSNISGEITDTTAVKNIKWEYTLYSTKQYSNPYKDVIVRVRFSNNDNSKTYDSFAFWDGDSTFKIRSYFPTLGIWRWETVCSDTENTGLHNQTGIIKVTEYLGDNNLYNHGALKISDNGKFITYADNTPFLWMGGTAWALPMAATFEEWKNYIDDRQSKGFTIVQITPAKIHGWTDFTTYPENYKGDKCFFSDDKWNPEYWKEYDKFVEYANSKGLVVVIVGLAEPVYDKFSEDNGALFARNLSARMDGFHVILSPAFDTYQPDWNSDYDSIGEQLSSSRHLITQHTGHTYADGPYNGFVQYFHSKSYLDFSMNHTGHNGGDLDVVYKKAREWNLGLYNESPTKPIFNTEALYSAGKYADQISNNERKGTDKNARQIGWLSWLSGALGYTYGAQGIWNYSEESDDGLIIPLDSALAFKSSGQMRILVDFFSSINWWQLVPKHNAIISDETDETKKMAFAVSDSGDFGVAFLPNNNAIKLDMRYFTENVNSFWLNPVTGKILKGEQNVANSGRHNFIPPYFGEWTLYLKNTNCNNLVWIQNLNITAKNNSIVLSFGQAKGATNGIDVIIGEESFSEPPIDTLFDARFILPNDTTTLFDVRNSEQSEVTWEISLQAKNEDYPLTLKWDKNEFPAGHFLLSDKDSELVNVNMKINDSLQITNQQIHRLTISYKKESIANIKYKKEWSLISIPFPVINNNVSALFADTNTSVFEFDGTYSLTKNLEFGKGYWIKPTDEGTFSVKGSEIFTPIELHDGWNLFGAYNQDVSLENLEILPEGILQSNIYSFENGYHIADTLKEGKGYWIKIKNSGQLNFTEFPANSIASKYKTKIAPKFSFNIFASDTTNNEIMLTFGLDSLATDSLDEKFGETEIPPLPPQGLFDIRILSADTLITTTTDIRNIKKNVQVHILKYQLSNSLHKLKLKWNLPLGVTMNISTLSNEGGLSLNYSSGKDSTTLPNIQDDKIKITFIYSDLILSERNNNIISYRFNLEQNYPNPFNPTTTIKYTLPVEKFYATSQHVELKVYDILGREVTTLVNKQQLPGKYKIVFNASGLSSGIYYYQLKAGKYIQTKKMILLR